MVGLPITTLLQISSARGYPLLGLGLRGKQVNEASGFRLTKRLVSRLPQGPVSFSHAFAVAALAVAIASLIRYLINPLVTGVPFITMFPAVMAASMFGGAYGGLMTAVLGGAIAAYVWLPPQNSFALTAQSWMVLATFFLASILIIAVAQLVHLLIRALRQAESRSELIAGEMKHRVSNLLQMTNALARQTFKDVDHSQRRVFSQRLNSMSAVLRMSDPVSKRDLKGVLQAVLGPISERFAMRGPEVDVSPELAIKLALLFNELATNATKYGALSADKGRVHIEWRRDENTLYLQWKETGGPPVEPPRTRGFGSQLIEAILNADEGESIMDFAPAGLICSVRILLVVAGPKVFGNMH
nr:DUF4118 domain-containing protein [Sinorhizobium mexicanum]